MTSHPALPRIPLQFPLAALGQASERHHSCCGTRGLCGQYPPALNKPRKLIPAPLAFPSLLEPWSQHTGNSLRKGRMAPSQTFLGPSFCMPPFDRNQGGKMQLGHSSEPAQKVLRSCRQGFGRGPFWKWLRQISTLSSQPHQASLPHSAPRTCFGLIGQLPVSLWGARLSGAPCSLCHRLY